MAIIGSDCNLSLRHTEVNEGEPFGFVLDPNSVYPEGIAIRREVFTELSMPMKLWVYFDVVLADDLINPDGSNHTETRSAMYDMLVHYLEKKEDLQVTFGMGVIVGLGAIEYSAIEKHYANYSTVRVHLTNVGAYFGVIDEEQFNNSVWDGVLTWATSYWR